MKNTIRLLLLAATLSVPSFAADDPAARSGAVDVTFDKPENFRDVKDSAMETERGRDANLTQFREYIQDRAKRYLAPGQRLSVTITDIDMAGEYEPWRGPSADNVRIVKSIYAPRIELTYKVADEAGAIVKEGRSKLSDLNFQNNLDTIPTSDPLRYEKRLLDDWLRREIRSKK